MVSSFFFQLRPVRLFPGLHDPREHGRGHGRAGHRLLQDPRRRQGTITNKRRKEAYLECVRIEKGAGKVAVKISN